MLNKKRKNVNKEKENENNIFNINLEDYSNNEIINNFILNFNNKNNEKNNEFNLKDREILENFEKEISIDLTIEDINYIYLKYLLKNYEHILKFRKKETIQKIYNILIFTFNDEKINEINNYIKNNNINIEIDIPISSKCSYIIDLLEKIDNLKNNMKDYENYLNQINKINLNYLSLFKTKNQNLLIRYYFLTILNNYYKIFNQNITYYNKTVLKKLIESFKIIKDKININHIEFIFVIHELINLNGFKNNNNTNIKNYLDYLLNIIKNDLNLLNKKNEELFCYEFKDFFIVNYNNLENIKNANKIKNNNFLKFFEYILENYMSIINVNNKYDDIILEPKNLNENNKYFLIHKNIINEKKDISNIERYDFFIIDDDINKYVLDNIYLNLLFKNNYYSILNQSFNINYILKASINNNLKDDFEKLLKYIINSNLMKKIFSYHIEFSKYKYYFDDNILIDNIINKIGYIPINNYDLFGFSEKNILNIYILNLNEKDNINFIGLIKSISKNTSSFSHEFIHFARDYIYNDNKLKNSNKNFINSIENEININNNNLNFVENNNNYNNINLYTNNKIFVFNKDNILNDIPSNFEHIILYLKKFKNKLTKEEYKFLDQKEEIISSFNLNKISINYGKEEEEIKEEFILFVKKYKDFLRNKKDFEQKNKEIQNNIDKIKLDETIDEKIKLQKIKKEENKFITYDGGQQMEMLLYFDETGKIANYINLIQMLMILDYQSYNLCPISFKFIFNKLITYNYFSIIIENFKTGFIHSLFKLYKFDNFEEILNINIHSRVKIFKENIEGNTIEVFGKIIKGNERVSYK